MDSYLRAHFFIEARLHSANVIDIVVAPGKEGKTLWRRLKPPVLRSCSHRWRRGEEKDIYARKNLTASLYFSLSLCPCVLHETTVHSMRRSRVRVCVRTSKVPRCFSLYKEKRRKNANWHTCVSARFSLSCTPSSSLLLLSLYQQQQQQQQRCKSEQKGTRSFRLIPSSAQLVVRILQQSIEEEYTLQRANAN